MKKILFILFAFSSFPSFSQVDLPSLDSVKMLLTTPSIEMALTYGVNEMYNNNFAVAESQFNWLKKNYPTHPMPNFLLGLSNWWKMMPDTDNTKYDFIFLTYMDSAIYYAEKMQKQDKSNVEAAFFLSAAYGFKGRLYSERKKWKKAAVAGKRSLRYLEDCHEKDYLSPELLFGDGLYNYYSVWIPDNYPALKPLLVFFRKGDQKKGIEQLEEVTKEGFYTRVEAQLFLMRIYSLEENQNQKAFNISQYLNKTFPNNPYFHRYYARMLYSTGKHSEMKEVSEQILERIENKWLGYEAISGRYASYYLAYYYDAPQKDRTKAYDYYKKVIDFAEESEDIESGYYHSALFKLAQNAESQKEYKLAMDYYDKILDNSSKKKTAYKKAKEFKKKYRKNKWGK